MKDRIILHLCADIGSDSAPYKKAGYKVICVGKDIGVENFKGFKGVHGIIANPVCTHLSWCRTNAKTPRDLEQGMFLVKHCLRIIWECMYELPNKNSKLTTLKWWFIENPSRGFLRQLLGIPAFVFQPYEYGDNYKKETALWGNFIIPSKKPIVCTQPKFDKLKTKEIHGKYYGKLTREERRSICSPGFAQAFFKANK